MNRGTGATSAMLSRLIERRSAAHVEPDAVIGRHDHQRALQEVHALEAVEQVADLTIDEPDLQ
jgi:hypothetical protein